MNQWDLPEPVARCQIPQTEIVDSAAIAAKYSLQVITETWTFKNAACQGALDLDHVDLAESILNQMKLLTKAEGIISQALKDQTNGTDRQVKT